MSRAVLATDRVIALLVGVVLAAAGVGAAAWYLESRGMLPGGVQLSDQVDTAALQTATSASWWPWASAAVGVLLVLLGLWWLAAHLPDRRLDRLRIAGTSERDRLEADAGSVANAAADALGRVDGVRSARGHLRRERGQLLLSLHATIEHGADLAEVARTCDQTSADVAHVLGRDDLRCRVRVQVAHRDRAIPRVG